MLCFTTQSKFYYYSGSFGIQNMAKRCEKNHGEIYDHELNLKVALLLLTVYPENFKLDCKTIQWDHNAELKCMLKEFRIYFE